MYVLRELIKYYKGLCDLCQSLWRSSEREVKSERPCISRHFKSQITFLENKELDSF
jgi:hypothetical protein